jgi:LEA14-like dessication related protein
MLVPLSCLGCDGPSSLRYLSVSSQASSRYFLYNVPSLTNRLSAIFPILAQRAVEKIDIQVQWVNLTNPDETSFSISAYSLLQPAYNLKATVSSMNLKIGIADQDGQVRSFAESVTKDLVGGGTAGMLVEDQRVTITNLTEYRRFSQQALNQKNFTVAVRGRARIRVGVLYCAVDLNRTVSMEGFNGLKDFDFISAMIKLKPDADGTNLIASVNVPNPSKISAKVGNLTVDLGINGTSIGTATVIDATIKPGNNTLNLRAALDELAFLSMDKTQFTKGTITIDSTGRSAVYNGIHLSFVEESFKILPFHTTLNLISIVDSIKIQSSTGMITPVMDVLTGQSKDPELNGLMAAFKSNSTSSAPSAKI